MLDRLGINLERAAGEGLGTRLQSVANRCRACRQAETCRSGSTTKRPAVYREFRPNASTFDTFRH
ncbi:MAG: DUF6455 family protein [Sulfurifustis sp.]